MGAGREVHGCPTTGVRGAANSQLAAGGVGRKSTLDLLQNVEKLAAASDEKRRQVHDRLQVDLSGF